ncbi:hypothetical protein GAPWK_2714 [Gilliamella apicola]|nr:hypothetical protein [Gilliamella apicola]AHN27287.1 hypothetical protein GAPWK_2714 [Gilliamella apicola]
MSTRPLMSQRLSRLALLSAVVFNEVKLCFFTYCIDIELDITI